MRRRVASKRWDRPGQRPWAGEFAAILGLALLVAPRLPQRDVRAAEVRAARAQLVLRGRLVGAAAGRRHGPARRPARRAARRCPGRGFLHGLVAGQACRIRSVPGRSTVPRARAGTLPDLLHPLPRRAGRRPGHDRPARLQSAATVCQRRAAEAADRPLLRCDDARVRDHVFLRLPDSAARPLGHRGVHPGASVEPARRGRQPAGRGSEPASRRG